MLTIDTSGVSHDTDSISGTRSNADLTVTITDRLVNPDYYGLGLLQWTMDEHKIKGGKEKSISSETGRSEGLKGNVRSSLFPDEICCVFSSKLQSVNKSAVMRILVKLERKGSKGERWGKDWN